MDGLTGFIQGLRSFFHLSVIELSNDGLAVVGSWNPNDGANFTSTYRIAAPTGRKSHQ